MIRAGISLLSIILFIFLLFAFPVQSYSAQSTGHDHEQHLLHSQAPNARPVVAMEMNPEKPKTGGPVKISFSIRDRKGLPVKELAISHERLLHVVIVSEDFSVFAHIHPEDFGIITDEMKKSALLSVSYTFPKAGRYLIAADYAVNGNHYSDRFPIEVSGRPKMDAIKKDFSSNRRFGDYEVSLSTDTKALVSGKKSVLTFRIMRNNLPVTNLQPYLAAPMHVAIIRADLDQFIHAHAETPGNESHPAGHIHGTADGAYGPQLEAQVIFPAKGLYKIFSQVRHDDKVLLFDFLVEVK